MRAVVSRICAKLVLISAGGIYLFAKAFVGSKYIMQATSKYISMRVRDSSGEYGERTLRGVRKCRIFSNECTLAGDELQLVLRIDEHTKAVARLLIGLKFLDSVHSWGFFGLFQEL
ncbi:hypothetical protein NDU88_009875 [Pleurodeles waltl]|uniref:Uncharacterized protein n=1 Tax=Pleurodeles waltl TaxID=8319 RepID=A0AAV7S1N4_PLEWA|nr:hypothetical protein NDU88_009875 [Pleurodeles waltl]